MQSPRNNIEAIYSLSPMQEGMLFHNLYDPQSEAHFGQSSFTLKGRLDVAAFKRAWQVVVERHPVLRTLFLWKRREKPLQVVRREVDLPFVELDWRSLSPPEQAGRFEVFLSEDRARGFDFSQAPLMRFSIIRLTDDTHRFVWSRHHIIVDGWSLPLIIDQVFAAYRALVRKQTPPSSSARPYRDYISWLQKQDLEQAAAYWRKTLKGFTSATQLGARERSSVPEHFDAHRIWLSESTTAQLQSLARQYHLTLNTVIQGAWSMLLSHYSGEEDIVFGTTVSGRPADLQGIETMVGLFINTLPMRVKLRGDESLLGWLHQLQEQQAEMRHYDYSPLVQIHEWSEIPRGHSLFESIFVFESYPVATVLKEGHQELAISEVVHLERSHYPLTMIVAAGKRMLLKLSFDASRFDGDTVQRMLKHLEVLLESIAADPGQHLANYSLLTEDEKQQALVAWNSTGSVYPDDRCVHQLLEEQVERTPDAAAVRYGDHVLTYFELNRRANQLAHYLQKLGVKPETRVGVMIEPSVEMMIGLAGILKSGGAYVPLDLSYPPQRLKFMLEDAAVDFLFTEQKHLEVVAAGSVTAVCIDTDRKAIEQCSDRNPRATTVATSLANIIYTSGSTGTPKGVSICHRGINRLAFNTNYMSWNGSGDRATQVSNTSFDAFTYEVWSALLNGAVLVGVSKDVALSPPAMVKLIQDHQINVMFLITALFNQIVGAEPQAFQSLRYLGVGGEAADAKTMHEMLSKGAPDHFANFYGPAESTTFATFHPLTVEETSRVQTIPIGGPVSNTQVYVLNRYLQPVPVGVAGDIYVGGDGLARGYWERPQLTAEKFVPHPFSQIPGERLYYTGDVGVYRRDGAIEFAGRRDEQIKIRGFRVELGEIEAALASYEGIREQVVIMREDQPGDRRLTAYVVTDQRLSAVDVRQYLQAKLPPYMVPAAYVELPALPLTANGKIDRRALPAPDQSNTADLDAYTAGRNAFEEEVIRIWSEVLMVDPIGAHDNFFDLGGHSLLAIQLVSKLRESFKVEISLRTLFEQPTPAQLSTALQAALRCEESAVPAREIAPVARDRSLPLSFAQQRLWFLDQLDPNSPAYNMPVALRLDGKLDLEALERSLNAIVARHEILRTCFPMERGKAVQVIAEQTAAVIELTDLSELSDSERATQTQATIKAEATEPFNLAAGPLFRARIIRLNDTEHILLLTMHHIVADGWSLGVLMKELRQLYANGERTLPVLPVQYADYAVWQRERMDGDGFERELDFWRGELKGAPEVLELNVAHGARRGQNNRGATERLSITEETTKQIKETTRREGVTLFMFLLTVFYVLLHYHSKREDIVVGVDVANRSHAATEGLIGLFVNQVVMRGDLSGKPNFRELLARVSAMTLRVYAHQDFPFDKLVDSLKVERQLGRNPLFQVMFGLQNLPRWTQELPGLTLTPLRMESDTTIFDLSLYMAETEQKLVGWMRYSTDLFTPGTIERMIDQYQTIVRKVVADPAVTLETLHDMLAADDQQRQLSKQTENRQALHKMLATVRPQPIKGVLSRT